MSDVIQRILASHAGRSMDEPRPPKNACLTSRETIEIADALAAAHEQIEALTAERDRLREALERVEREAYSAVKEPSWARVQRIGEMARRGLARAALRTADEGEDS